MSYSPRTRDIYRGALFAVTGLSTVGALTGSGWLAGNAAASHEKQMATEKAEKQQAERERLEKWYAENPQVVTKNRPVVTEVETRTVPAAEVGTGGSMSGSTPEPTSSSSSGGSAPAPAPAPAAPAPAPEPPPAPAPSGGS
ncbi:MAG TPA: hypothetical protein VFJ28_12200 [Marmoricola sp.]|nr:hypothetical protein [Marmoricola sp.]